ncbi:MAG: hypothetical protein C0502_05060 [Opitutus sp.]|nr:hypothetical protein [Opitutus sp.]
MISFGPANRVAAVDGTAAAPSIAFNSDPDTGFYRYGANAIGVSSGGAYRFRFDANSIYGPEGNNNLTMGSAGAIFLTASGINQNITFTPSGTGWAQIGGAVDGQLRLYNSANSELIRLRVDGNPNFINTGDLLLGTGATASNGRVQLVAHGTAAGGVGFYDFSLYRSGAQAARLNASLTVDNNLTVSGTFAPSIVDASTEYRVAGTKVVGTRITGWNFGLALNRLALVPGTATASDVANVVNALLQDLKSHGLIG